MEQSKTGNCSALSVQVRRRKNQNWKSNFYLFFFFLKSITQHDCESSRNAGKEAIQERGRGKRKVSSSVSNGGSDGNRRRLQLHISRTGFLASKSNNSHSLDCHRCPTGQRAYVTASVSVIFPSVQKATSSFSPPSAELINTSAEQARSMTHRWLYFLHSKALTKHSNYHDCKDLLFFSSLIVTTKTVQQSLFRLIYFELSDK